MTARDGHRVSMEWMGDTFETLADLFPVKPRAICVGINPAPVSVASGHYYQGRQGQRFNARLRQAGVLAEPPTGWFDDDLAVEHGIGFTDIVKRPTPSADAVGAEELRYGAAILAGKLEVVAPPVLIFPFKAVAVASATATRTIGTLRGGLSP